MNRAGKLLIDMASNLGCIITTGRTPGDTGQPTFVGYNKSSKSRPDHVMVSKTFFAHVLHQRLPCLSGLTTVFSQSHSQLMHACLTLTYAYTMNLCIVLRDASLDGNLKGLPITSHTLSKTRLPNNNYTGPLMMKMWNRRGMNLEHGFDAALQTGMTTSGTLTCKRPFSRGAAWFDDTCQEKKQMLLAATKRGEDTHLKDKLEREHKAQVQPCKSRSINAEKSHFYKNYSTKNNLPAVHKLLKQPTTKHVTPVSESSWHNHLNRVFRQALVSRLDDAEGSGMAGDRPRA